MVLKAKDVVPINQVRAKFTELAEEVRTGSEKIMSISGTPIKLIPRNPLII